MGKVGGQSVGTPRIVGYMKKPMELTIYPKPERPRFTYRGDYPAHEMRERRREHALLKSKRLTESELAAEFEAARCDSMLADATGSYWAPLGETWPSDKDSALSRTMTLLRFASLPHYDERYA